VRKQKITSIVWWNFLMEEEFCARWTAERRRVVFFASVRWIVRSIKRSGRRRGHESVRKHDV
jgi:hypothetical protein